MQAQKQGEGLDNSARPGLCWHSTPQPQTAAQRAIPWREYLWDPARLDAWLHQPDCSNTSSSIGSGHAQAAGHCQQLTQQAEAHQTEQPPVPHHLRQLLLMLLQAAADTGKGQDLIWTPSRLTGWLADDGQAAGASISPGSSPAVSARLPPAHGVLQVPSCMQLLPLVSSVAAYKARAEQGGTGCRSSSSVDTDASLALDLAHSDTPQPSSSAQSTVFCAGDTQPAGAGDELTSPAARQPPQLPHGAGMQDWMHGQQQRHHHQQHQQGGPSMQPCSQQELHKPPAPISQHALVASFAAGQQQGMGVHQQVALSSHKQAQLGQQLVQPKQQPQLLPLLQQMRRLHEATNARQQAQHLLPSAPRQDPAAAAAAAGRQGLPRKEAQPGDYPVVEDNTAWDPTALCSSAAAAASTLGLPLDPSAGPHAVGSTAAADGPCSPDSSTTPRFGVLMLVHEKGVPAAEVWQAWEGLQGGRAVVRVHLKQGVSTAGLPGAAWVGSRQLPSRVCSKWGCISLTAAILQAAAELLQQHPHLQHIALVSGQDLPVSAVPRDLRPGLTLFGRFQFGREFDAAAQQVASEVLQSRLGMSQRDSHAWGAALVFHHTWMVLDRQLLLALISRKDEVLAVGAVLNERFMQADVAVAADEFMLITAAKRYGFVKQVVHKKLQTHMSTLRRQHREKPFAATARQQQQQQRAEQHADWGAGDDEPPAKQQRTAAPGLQDAGWAGRGARSGSGSGRSSSAGSREGSVAAAEAGSGGGSSGGSSRGEGAVAQAGSAGAAAEGSTQRLGVAAGRRSRRDQAGEGSAAAEIPPEELVGRRIRVWWELDQDFYTGMVTYYSLSTRRHTVRYDDGDVEIINLSKESWQLEGPSPAAPTAHHPRSSSSTGAQQRSSSSGGGGSSGGSSGGAAASPLHEGTFGVLLDCCPTLALFHPTQTRHPHEWCSFAECLLVDVQSHRPGNNRLTLLQALGLAQPNSALFFRKVAQLQPPAAAQLLGCLKLLWRNRPLPALIEELQLQE